MEVATLTAQLHIENSVSELEDSLPKGYIEALADCHALAVNLLHKALTGEDIKRCWDCNSWVGRCLKGRPNQIARLEACDLFTPKLHRRQNDAF